MEQVNLPKTATIQGIKVRLDWGTMASMDGWYAEMSKRTLRKLERDQSVNMYDAEAELAQVGNYARYGQERTGETYLCVYIRA